MNNTSLSLSPYIQNIVAASGFEVISILRYGPRYACLQVVKDDVQGFMKISLPIHEQEQFRPDDYFWSEYDQPTELNRRLIKEADVLAHLSIGPDAPHQAMKVIATQEEDPIWTVRTFIPHSNMALGDTNFAFDPSFYDQVEPSRLFEYFHDLHRIGKTLPPEATRHFKDYDYVAFTLRMRDSIKEYLTDHPAYHSQLPVIDAAFERAVNVADKPEPVLTHGEAYPPHIYDVDGELMMIDWENAKWRTRYNDLVMVYVRSYPNPDWQQGLVSAMEEAGYLDADGLLHWRLELLQHCLAEHAYFRSNPYVVSEEYDSLALSYFDKVISDVINALAE